VGPPGAQAPGGQVLRHVEEVTGNIAMTCRYFGISRPTYYTWLRRYEAEGPAGLRERSKAPETSPNATSTEVVGKIIHLRQNYHFGPTKIAMYLKRYPDVDITKSGVWRILKRLQMNRLPASQRYKRHDRRWKRYEKQQPGHRVQIDVKFFGPLPGASSRKKDYQYTAIDDCTRLRVLKISPQNNQKTAVQFVDCVLQRHPFTSKSSKRTMVQNSSQRSTGMSSTKGSSTSTSNPARHASTAKWSAPTASCFTGSSTGSSLTTPTCSTTNSGNGRTTTTTTARTAVSTAKPPYERPWVLGIVATPEARGCDGRVRDPGGPCSAGA
jgi:transposase